MQNFYLMHKIVHFNDSMKRTSAKHAIPNLAVISNLFVNSDYFSTESQSKTFIYITSILFKQHYICITIQYTCGHIHLWAHAKSELFSNPLFDLTPLVLTPQHYPLCCRFQWQLSKPLSRLVKSSNIAVKYGVCSPRDRSIFQRIVQ